MKLFFALAMAIGSLGYADCPIVDYIYVCGDSEGYAAESERLPAKVTDKIKKGWEPVGGMCSYNTRYGTAYFCQAMVKRKCPPTPTPTPTVTATPEVKQDITVP